MPDNNFKKTFCKNLKYYMDKKGVKQSDIVNHFKLAKSTVSSWCTGIKMPRMDKLEMLAEFLEVNKSDLLENAPVFPANAIPLSDITFTKIPVIGRVAAGIHCLADMDIIDYEPVPAEDVSGDDNYVYLCVVGDSMYPKIEEGDLVLVRCQTSVDSGSIAVVIIDDEDGVVKKVVYGKDFIELHSTNPMYPVRRFDGKDVLRVRVFGLVKEIVRKL